MAPKDSIRAFALASKLMAGSRKQRDSKRASHKDVQRPSLCRPKGPTGIQLALGTGRTTARQVNALAKLKETVAGRNMNAPGNRTKERRSRNRDAAERQRNTVIWSEGASRVAPMKGIAPRKERRRAPAPYTDMIGRRGPRCSTGAIALRTGRSRVARAGDSNYGIVYRAL
jgi:hypothetical protein